MADPIGEKLSKRGGLLGKAAMNDPLFMSQRKAAAQAEKDQKRQKAKIAAQQKIEEQRVAREGSEVKRRQAMGMSGKGGRASLIATTQSGLPSNLGATANG